MITTWEKPSEKQRSLFHRAVPILPTLVSPNIQMASIATSTLSDIALFPYCSNQDLCVTCQFMKPLAIKGQWSILFGTQQTSTVGCRTQVTAGEA